jgi:hypothetical protein
MDNTTTDGVKVMEIDGREYVFHKLPATKATRVMTRLIKLFGNGLVQMLFGAARVRIGEERKGEITDGDVAALFSQLQVFNNLADDDLVDVQRMLFYYVWTGNQRIYSGKDTDIDLAFTGCEADSLRVMWEAIAYNFRPIFPAALSRFIREKAMAGSVQ